MVSGCQHPSEWLPSCYPFSILFHSFPTTVAAAAAWVQTSEIRNQKHGARGGSIGLIRLSSVDIWATTAVHSMNDILLNTWCMNKIILPVGSSYLPITWTARWICVEQGRPVSPQLATPRGKGDSWEGLIGPGASASPSLYFFFFFSFSPSFSPPALCSLRHAHLSTSTLLLPTL